MSEQTIYGTTVFKRGDRVQVKRAFWKPRQKTKIKRTGTIRIEFAPRVFRVMLDGAYQSTLIDAERLEFAEVDPTSAVCIADWLDERGEPSAAALLRKHFG